MKQCRTADEYFDNARWWQPELDRLRKILLSLGLTEHVKWGGPVYTCDGQNVVGLGAYKSWVALWFFQGALLKDDLQVLVNAQTGKTKAQRQWRFADAKQIKVGAVRAYVREAMELARSGAAVPIQRNKPLEIPPELIQALAQNKRARSRFDKMSKSCRREYAEYIAEAKRDDTKQRRLQKILPMIAGGGGLNDRYR